MSVKIKKSIFVTAQEIAFARDNGNYTEADHWQYVKDRFMFEHGVTIIDRSKLELHVGQNNLTMRITGTVGVSISSSVR